jgi:parallel beta-helix repeat protein
LIVSIIASSGAVVAVQAGGLTVTEHSVISINNDAELAATASSGSGTAAEPFVIEGLEIDATGYRNAIFIGNTTLNVTIRGCHLYGASYSSRPFEAGAGITMYLVTNATVNNNTCSGNRYGIELSSSSNIVIENNNFSGNGAGISLQDSSNNLVENNTCSSNDYYGIYMSSSSNNLVENNTCCLNDHFGMYLISSSSNNDLRNNTICQNDNYVIYITSSSNYNRVYGNYLIDNHGGPVKAYDDWTNYWNTTSYGNYWSDWQTPDNNSDGIVDSPYVIDSTTFDHYLLVRSYVTIATPVDSSMTNRSSVLVTGTANPHCKLVVNGIVVYVKNDGSFSARIALDEGTNVIEAISIAYFPSSDRVTVTYVNELQEQVDEQQDEINQKAILYNHAEYEAVAVGLILQIIMPGQKRQYDDQGGGRAEHLD